MKLLDYYITLENHHVWKRSDRSFFIKHGESIKLVKQITSQSLGKKSFIVLHDIPNVNILTKCDTVSFGDELYEIHDVNRQLHSADIRCFRKLINLYDYNDKISMLTPMFRNVGYFIDETAHAYTPHYGESLGDVCEQFKIMTAQYARRVQDCQRGWFHGDMHYGNILTDDKKLYIVDLDDVMYSYTALNLAMPFYIEVFAKYRGGVLSLDDFKFVRRLIRDNLADADTISFDFFALLMSFWWNVRTVPHIVADLGSRKETLKGILEKDFKIVSTL